MTLKPKARIGGLALETGETPLPGASWYVAGDVGDGLGYSFEPGALAAALYLTADLLLDGNQLATFILALKEGEDGPGFQFRFDLLNQCQARMRVPLAATRQNRWRYRREGAWLKPGSWGERVYLRRVDRMELTVERKGDKPTRWCMTPVTAVSEEPPVISDPILPNGPLLDELGQSEIHDWPAKTRSPEEVTGRLRDQAARTGEQAWPESFGRWGGWKEQGFEATGFFRTHHDGRRWWLVDPDGHPFWSVGVNGVRVDTGAAYTGLEKALDWMPNREGPYGPSYELRDASGNFMLDRPGVRALGEGVERPVPQINYLTANLIRAFGPEGWYERWAMLTLARLRGLGFNTVASFSDWWMARDAGFPYVRRLSQGTMEPFLRNTPMIYRDFPDVFHEGFAEDAARFAEPLRETAEDPAMLGYFLMNEPTWGFAGETPAAGMLHATPSCPSRRALADFLRERYGNDAALSAAWDMAVSFSDVAEGEWTAPLTPAAEADLADFSTVLVERFFGTLSAACRAADPNHLNLGARYYTVPPRWATAGMRAFDVLSFNVYKKRLPAGELAAVCESLGSPMLVGEWHFGALDVGLPWTGVGTVTRVEDQAARGRAYRAYFEDAASQPWCVGAHWYQLYDQSALGRFDGENHNIGFIDVCNRPHEPLADAARRSHERLYRLASGDAEPYAEGTRVASVGEGSEDPE